MSSTNRRANVAGSSVGFRGHGLEIGALIINCESGAAQTSPRRREPRSAGAAGGWLTLVTGALTSVTRTRAVTLARCFPVDAATYSARRTLIGLGSIKRPRTRGLCRGRPASLAKAGLPALGYAFFGVGSTESESAAWQLFPRQKVAASGERRPPALAHARRSRWAAQAVSGVRSLRRLHSSLRNVFPVREFLAGQTEIGAEYARLDRGGDPAAGL